MSRLGPQHFGGPLHEEHFRLAPLREHLDEAHVYSLWLADVDSLLADADVSALPGSHFWRASFSARTSPQAAVAEYFAFRRSEGAL